MADKKVPVEFSVDELLVINKAMTLMVATMARDAKVASGVLFMLRMQNADQPDVVAGLVKRLQDICIQETSDLPMVDVDINDTRKRQRDLDAQSN